MIGEGALIVEITAVDLVQEVEIEKVIGMKKVIEEIEEEIEEMIEEVLRRGQQDAITVNKKVT